MRVDTSSILSQLTLWANSKIQPKATAGTDRDLQIQGLLSRIRSQLASRTTGNILPTDPAGVKRDLQTQGLLTRIRYARNLSRRDRDSLASMVKQLAVNERLDHKTIKSIMELIMVMEFSNFGKTRERSLAGRRENTVQQDMEDVRTTHNQRDAQKERLETLRNRFSTLV